MRALVAVVVIAIAVAGCAERAPPPSPDTGPVEATLTAEAVGGPARGPYRWGIPLPTALAPEAWLANATVQGGRAEIEETERGPVLLVNAIGRSSVATNATWVGERGFTWSVPGNTTVLARDPLTSLALRWSAEDAACRTEGAAQGENLHGWHDLQPAASTTCD